MSRLRRAVALAFHWQHPIGGALSIPAVAGFAAWALSRLSALDRVPTNNRAAALGVLTIAALGNA